MKAIAGDAVRVLQESGEGAALIETWKGVDFVILVDAVHSGGTAGTIYRFDAKTNLIPGSFFHYSTHAFSVAAAVEMARALNQLPHRLVVYGIERKTFNSGVGLSPAVEAAADEVLRSVKETMHELSLIIDLMRKIDVIAREQGARRVVGVKVRLGALSHISPAHLREHFEAAATGTIAEAATLDIEALRGERDPYAQSTR